jgi:hypothetical protein
MVLRALPSFELTAVGPARGSLNQF